jgi:hypothetical protein
VKTAASLRSIALAVPLIASVGFAAEQEFPAGGRIIDPKSHHLGSSNDPGWQDASPQPKGKRLEINFDARANSTEFVLAIRLRHVDDRWRLDLNGRRLGELRRGLEPQIGFFILAPGALKDGQNELAIVPVRTNSTDDIAVGPIAVYEQTFRDVLKLQPVAVSVADKRTGKAVPARITITDLKEQPVEVFYADRTNTATRLGTIYSRGEETEFELPQGDYLVYATRGMEWGRDRKKISVGKSKVVRAELRIEREVDTTGFVAADTHIHTVTFSGHGDASIQERMLTLAGEGVELAVSTDHNHNIDYRPYQREMRVTEYFTPVTGNEVTTPVGHMNGFPLDPKDEVPAFKLNDWVQLVDGIRAKGARFVQLNHPRWPSLEKCPVTVFGLNRGSGEFTNGWRFPFDGMELANALTPQADPLLLFGDWFALLNRGYKITAIGSSDSHTVGEPVGQGRSYVPSKTDDPTKIDVNDACERFLRGETTISLGIFADVTVDGRYKTGQTNSISDSSVNVRLRVQAPSWIAPRRALVFLNGQQVAEKVVPARSNRPTDETLRFNLPKPKQDAHFVCVVIGDGASHPSWRTGENFTLAATNPVFLDADGDGKYSSPRDSARFLLSRAGKSPDEQWAAASVVEDAIAVQMVSLMRKNLSGAQLTALDGRVREAAKQRPLFAEYVRLALPVKVEALQLR